MLGIVLIGLLIFGSIGSILMVGQPRQPKTPGDAVIEVFINVGLIIWILFS